MVDLQQQMQQMYAQLQRDIATQVSQATVGSSSTPAATSGPKVYLPKIRQPSPFVGTIGLAVDHWLSEMEQQFAYYAQGGALTTDALRIQYAAGEQAERKRLSTVRHSLFREVWK
jgi:hypothetical protein